MDMLVHVDSAGTSFELMTHYIALKQSTIENNARLFFNGDLSAVSYSCNQHQLFSNIMEAKKVLLIATGEEKLKQLKA